MAILELKQVNKYYDKYHALRDVSLSIEPQSIFGLLGPNGAGKTTMIRIITGITAADQGDVIFNDKPFQEHHVEEIGYMPEERGLYKKMKVWEQLVYLAQLKGLSAKDAKDRVYAWMEKMDIKDWWNKKIEELSKGMSQKIQFISTVVHEPRLIILDEPFSGLDPVNSVLIQNEIEELRLKGATILFSTHRMEQVEEICEQIALINKGKIILNGRVKDIKQQFKQNLYSVELLDPGIQFRNDYFNVVSRDANQFKIKLANGATSKDLLKTLVEQDADVLSFREVLPSLNEIFIKQVTEGTHE
ncbi:MAG: ATP-binding cassette domain-containing protein [Bacteroidetes bacterium]|nr:ATP-binding cassette domain-containing protein [Bacteroidota bacterium]GDX47897.1 ABC transporter ATP-binding protein [Bacteroidota bacterium]